MSHAIQLESFLAAIACLCSSSFGPSLSNYSTTGRESNILGALSQMDLNVLKILGNSNTKFTIKDTDINCAIPNSDEIGVRLKLLEESIRKQREGTKKLEKYLENLSSNSPSKCDCEQKNVEIEKLQQKIAALESNKQTLSKNICVRSSKHGFTEIPSLWPFKIFCDKNLHKKYGEGWMLMAQRFNGKGHFFQRWENYSKGIGPFDESSEFFMGLQILSILTNKLPHELLIILTDRDNVVRYAYYDLFTIGSEEEKFALKNLGKYTGDAGDALRYHVGQKFSTWEHDNDGSPINCAVKHSGAWWYKGKNCLESNLFGIYKSKRTENTKNRRNGMIWSTFHDTNDGYLLSMRMYIRSKED